jgi:hypothetical protein
MIKMLRKRRVKNLVYTRFIEYRDRGDWYKAGIYAERYIKLIN